MLNVFIVPVRITGKQFLLLSVFFILSVTALRAQLSPVWVQRVEGSGDHSDKYNAVAADAAGNICLAGYSVREGHQRDFLVAKTDANGDTLWMRYINGSNDGDDEAMAVAVDASGNVYATGYTDSDKSNLDYLTVKYDGNGNLLWAVAYNYEMAWHDDKAVALAVDSLGNVYVTGSSDGSATVTENLDFATVKYDAAGAVQYVARKNGFGNAKDEVVAIAADNNGNCYIAGRSDSGNDDDYITVKYGPAGTALWTKLYDGGNGDDRPAALVLTAVGDVVVTGRRDAGAGDDIVTIGYSNAGTQLWQRNFNGSGNGNDRPAAIAADPAGNILVAGESDADPSFALNYDFVILRYTSNGTFSWVSYYAGSGNGADGALDVTADNNGTVYVTGQADVDPAAAVNLDMVTVKYDQNGTQQWARVEGGNAGLEDGGYSIVLNNNADPVVAGKMDSSGSQQDAALVHYDQAGTAVFLKTFNGEGDFSDNAFALQTDQNGNVFVAGYTYVRDQNRNLMIRKYDSGGNILKTFTFDGSRHDADELSAMVLDGSGNVYVTGFVKNSGTSSDFVTIRLNNNLDTSWVRYYNHTANESDKAVSIAIDGFSNVYVTGYSDNNPSDTIDSDDIVTIKYAANGASQWTIRYNGPANGDERPVQVLTDGNGNTVVTGKSWNGSGDDMLTLQYGPTGSQQWVMTCNGSGNGNDRAAAMVLDNSGSVYVTGSGFAGTAFDDYITVKYNQAGVQQWLRTYNGSGNDDDKASCITLDGNGNVLVSGHSDSDTSLLTKNYDYLTLKYDNSGNFLWASSYDGSSGTDDWPACITTDAAGNIYVAGESENGTAFSPNKDFAMVAYRASGSQFLYALYDGPASATDGAKAITLSGSSLYLAGNSQGLLSQKDAAVIKYDITSGMDEPHGTHEMETLLFPNPAGLEINLLIPEGLTASESFHLDVFNCLGEQVRVPIIENGLIWKLDLQDLPPGLYLCRLCSGGNFSSSGHFIRQ